jgi:uncharacterized membrane protein YdfJ with MMPL/SSD domain
MIAILFSLAMDYEVFLVSRMRETYARAGKALESTVKAFRPAPASSPQPA